MRIIWQQFLRLAPGRYSVALSIKDESSIRNASEEVQLEVPRLAPDMLGSPQKILVDPKIVVSMRDARAKQAQAQNSGMAAMGAADTAKVLSETNVGGGQSALNKVLGLAA